MSLLQDFKTFVMRGNLVELAVAFVMGAVFAALLKAFIADLITPIIALVFGQHNFSTLSFTINGSHFAYAALQRADGPPQSGGSHDQAVPGVHQRRPAPGAALSVVHVAHRRSDGVATRRQARPRSRAHDGQW